MAPAAYVAANGLVWVPEGKALGPAKTRTPSVCQGWEVGRSAWLGGG